MWKQLAILKEVWTVRQKIFAIVVLVLLLDVCVTSDKLFTHQDLTYLPKMKWEIRVISSGSFSAPHSPYGASNTPAQTIRTKKQAEVLNSHFKGKQPQNRPFHGPGHEKLRCHFHNKAFLKPTSWPMGKSSKRQLLFCTSLVHLSPCILVIYLICLSLWIMDIIIFITS